MFPSTRFTRNKPSQCQGHFVTWQRPYWQV